MSFSSCLSPESDLSDINGVAEDLELVLLVLKTPAVEQLLENTFPTPDLGKENLTCLLTLYCLHVVAVLLVLYCLFMLGRVTNKRIPTKKCNKDANGAQRA